MTYPVVVPVGDHAEQHHGVTLIRSLGHQQVVRPAAAAEIELGGFGGARVAGARALRPEGALVGDGDGRVEAAAADRVVARTD